MSLSQGRLRLTQVLLAQAPHKWLALGALSRSAYWGLEDIASYQSATLGAGATLEKAPL